MKNTHVLALFFVFLGANACGSAEPQPMPALDASSQPSAPTSEPMPEPVPAQNQRVTCSGCNSYAATSGTVYQAQNCQTIVAHAQSRVYAGAGSTVFAWANSETYASSGATVYSGDHAIVHAYPGSTVLYNGNANVYQCPSGDQPPPAVVSADGGAPDGSYCPPAPWESPPAPDGSGPIIYDCGGSLLDASVPTAPTPAGGQPDAGPRPDHGYLPKVRL